MGLGKQISNQRFHKFSDGSPAAIFLDFEPGVLFHRNREVTRKTRDNIVKVSSLNEIIKFHNKFRPLVTAFFSQSRNNDMLGDWLL